MGLLFFSLKSQAVVVVLGARVKSLKMKSVKIETLSFQSSIYIVLGLKRYNLNTLCKISGNGKEPFS